MIKFIYSEKATKFCEIFTLLLTVCIVVKSKVKISQNFVAFSEYMNFTSNDCRITLFSSQDFPSCTLFQPVVIRVVLGWRVGTPEGKQMVLT